MLVWYGLTAGARNRTRMIFFKIFSRGCPFFSYIAKRKNGSITIIMHRVAVVFPADPLSKKKSGTPKSTAGVKQTSCLFVNPNSTFALILERSFGTVT